MAEEKEAEVQCFVVKVNMDCEGCRNKVHKALQKIDGVQGFSIDPSQNKATVKGTIAQEKLVKKLARKTKKRIELLKEEERSKDNSKEKEDASKIKETPTQQQMYNYNDCPSFIWQERRVEQYANYTDNYSSNILYESEEESCAIM